MIRGDDSLSFGALHDAAEAAAAGLRTRGIGRGDVVALHLRKRSFTYVLLFACLRLGAPYVFTDTRSPEPRIRQVLDRVRPRLLVSEEELTNPHGEVLRVGGLQDLPAGEPTALPRPETVLASDPAYIMFTSGSTGEPKGAVLPHQGVLHLMDWARGLFGTGGERFSAINPLHFDNSVFDIYCGLTCGHSIVPVETAEADNPMLWVRALRQGAPTVMFAVPTLFLILDQLGLLNPQSLPSVRSFLFGGEGFPKAAVERFRDRFEGQARLINVYGPTETSCICSSIEIGAAALGGNGDRLPSLGRMHDGFSHALLDPDGQSVPRGSPGELWIGGPCVALGYYANQQETAAKFLQNPAHDRYRDVWYRTGDLVREDADGLLWFHGRADNQVKIRGHRIELEELDLAVQSVPDVSRALAVAVPTEDGAELAVVFAADRPIDFHEVYETCRALLPGYMLPSRVRQVEELPRNASGKVDRRAAAALIEAAVP